MSNRNIEVETIDIDEVGSEELVKGLCIGLTKGLTIGFTDGLAKGIAEGKSEGLAKGAKGIIEISLEFGLSLDEIIYQLKDKLKCTDDEANSYIQTYNKKNTIIH